MGKNRDLALSTRGPFELDETSTVILPDGERCTIRDLVVYTPAIEKLDKAKEEDKDRDKE